MPRNGRISACARIPAEKSTITCETTVNRNVFQSACRKILLFHSAMKLCSPTQWPLSEPAVASVKLR